MSNTIRKDKNGKEYKESLKKREARCRCEYYLGKKDVIEKIAEKEMKSDGYYYDDEIIWDKQGELCNDYCCTVKDEDIISKYVINFGEK